ncbi:GNAT family N-acetyltransferase [Virgibacillus sp. DJP39]|uniref:GNAT family N-acetyltransferase n=1 Tax=Virgibacillus sp. DJP39 TaxID=3409790 RepID=UPI003BB7B77D
MYKIRQAQENDYETIFQLNNSLKNMRLLEVDSIIEREYYDQSLLREQDKWFVVENTGELIAFIYFTYDLNKLSIKNFIVHSDYKKKGIDEHLYKKMEQIAFNCKLMTMQVEISPEYTDVIDFFERKEWVKETGKKRLYLKYIR